MQVEKNHRIRVEQLSVKRNRANEMKQNLLGTKEEGEFIIQHIDNKSQFREKKFTEMYNLLLSKKA